RAVGIILQMHRDFFVSLDGVRARSERRLVGRQLEHLRHARRAALARDIRIDIEHAGTRLGIHAHRLSLVAPSRGGLYLEGTVWRLAWLPTRAFERREAPVPRNASATASIPPRATKISNAAPSKARSGTAMASASPARLSTDGALQPETRILHTSVSVTMA